MTKKPKKKTSPKKKNSAPRGFKKAAPKDADFPFMVLADGSWSTMRPPEGGQFSINFGPFLVMCTHEGAAIILTSPLRKELAMAAVDGSGKDRLICLWPDKRETDSDIEREARFAKVFTASLDWMPQENVP